MLDVERTAIQDDVSFEANATGALGGNKRCAASCATSHRHATTAFPDAHADRIFVDHLCKFNVAAVRENLVHFEDASPIFKLDFFDIVNENNGMRIAHRNRYTCKIKSICRELDRSQEIARETHIYTNTAIRQNGWLHKTAFGMQDKIAIVAKTATLNKLRNTTRGITAHGSFGTVCVENAHFKLVAFYIFVYRSHDNYPVSANAKASIAKFNYTLFQSLAWSHVE